MTRLAGLSVWGPALCGSMHKVIDRRVFLAASLGLFVPHKMQASARLFPLRRLHLVNAHTGETFDGPFRDDIGPLQVAMTGLSNFLRDHYSGEKTAFDIGVLDFLASIMEAVGVTDATVLSAYRTPKTNALLARTTFGVAEHSQHIYGRALDVRRGSGANSARNEARWRGLVSALRLFPY